MEKERLFKGLPSAEDDVDAIYAVVEVLWTLCVINKFLSTEQGGGGGGGVGFGNFGKLTD